MRVKKKIGILLLGAALLCSGCGWNDDEPVKDDLNEPSTSPGVIESIPVAVDGQEPYWAQGVQQDGKLYQNLNLDGVGEADDEAYVSIYRFGDDNHSTWAMVLRVRLGTGEIMAEIYPIEGFYEFETGKLLSEDRDAIILSTVNGYSNYNATNFLVLKVSPANPAEYIGASIWAALDTAAQPDGKSLDILKGNGSSWGLRGLDGGDGSTIMTWAPEVVDIDGSSLQGLKVTIFDPYEGAGKELENVIYWKDGLWDDGDRAYLGKWEFLGEWTPKAE